MVTIDVLFHSFLSFVRPRHDFLGHFPDKIAGHAGLLLIDGTTDTPTITTCAGWPDDHPDIIAKGLNNGDGSDMRKDFFRDKQFSVDIFPFVYCARISDEQYKDLLNEVNKDYQWSCLNNCASFAARTFGEVTGIDIDEDDVFGIDTPREIGESIREANGGSNLPSDDDIGVPDGPSDGNAFSSSFEGQKCEEAQVPED